MSLDDLVWQSIKKEFWIIWIASVTIGFILAVSHDYGITGEFILGMGTGMGILLGLIHVKTKK